MRKKNKGFSLIEVMVALVVVAVALGGVVTTVGSMARNQTIIGERTFARWVAANQIATAQIERQFPDSGKLVTGASEMAGAEWQWEQKIIETLNEDVRRIEVTVRLADVSKEKGGVMLVGFLTR